jgi:hypothetical protein
MVNANLEAHTERPISSTLARTCTKPIRHAENHFSAFVFKPCTGMTLFEGAVQLLVDLLHIHAVASSNPVPEIGDLD